MVVYVNDVDVERKRIKVSLQPKLTCADLQIGEQYEGIVTDASKPVGLIVALSDDLSGLVRRQELGAGAFSEDVDENGWQQRSVYTPGDRLTVWVVGKGGNLKRTWI